MANDIRHENESFQQDYDKLYAKGQWSKDDLCMMKDLKKLIYYNLAIDHMQNGKGHPGEGRLPEMSYGMDRTHPYYPDTGSGMGMSGRRYYDGDMERAIRTLRHMKESTDDPVRMHALQAALDRLETY